MWDIKGTLKDCTSKPLQSLKTAGKMYGIMMDGSDRVRQTGMYYTYTCLNVFTLQRITMHNRTDMHDSSGTTEGENMLCCTSNAKIKYIHFAKPINELVADPD